MKHPLYHSAILTVCTGQHLTADTVFAQVQHRHPRVGKATVYRSIDTLCRSGQLVRIAGEWTSAYYETVQMPHAHMVVEPTGEIVDLPLPKWFDISVPVGFEITSVDVRIRVRPV